jgi:penicillin-binding protein 2
VPSPLDQRRPPITPQLAVRVAVLGGVALAAFALIFFRLWFLQVLSGEDYVSQASNNRVRKVRIEAPRGDIVDRNGDRLVETRQAPVVQLEPDTLPQIARDLADVYRLQLAAAEGDRLAAGDRLRAIERNRKVEKRSYTTEERQLRKTLARAARRARPVGIPSLPKDEAAALKLYGDLAATLKLRPDQVAERARTGAREAARSLALYRSLGEVLDMSTREIHVRVIRAVADAPFANVTVQTDVEKEAFDYLVERRDRFPGVLPETVYLRNYPHKTLAAQLFGTQREISPSELEDPDNRKLNLEQGDHIGKDGLEEEYDRYLRGTPGFDKFRVDSLGERDERYPVTRRKPRQGNRLKLTLDLKLQQAADSAMQFGIESANRNGLPAKAGAYVAMNPKTGAIYAIGSYPSFDANVFARPLSQRTFNALVDDEQGAPLTNRAISATYPTGSTFKPITAIASLAEGILTPQRTIIDDGLYELGPQKYRNAKDAKFGPIQLSEALKVSSDVFFYTLGGEANARGAVIQRWARKLGLGKTTGIDLPGEFGGLVPDRRWRDAEYSKYQVCAKKAGVPEGTVAALNECGGIEKPWTPGDNVNLSVGQGDLQATPLQMAVAYSTIANGGRKPVPHLGQAIEDGVGRPVLEIERRDARSTVPIDPAWQSSVLEGLRKAAMEPGGTSYDVMKGLTGAGLTIYGKTGTVERYPNPDQSWYAAYVPHETQPMVVVVTVEKGGFGAESAAPAACRIISRWFLERRDVGCQPGASETR